MYLGRLREITGFAKILVSTPKKILCLYPNGELTYNWNGLEQKWDKTYSVIKEIV